MRCPYCKHIFENKPHLSRSIGQIFEIPLITLVPVVVARVCQGNHYKTSLDQRKSSVIVTGQRTSCTVRYQNKRQSIPRNLTVDRHSLAERPKRLRGCLPNARIPDTNRKWLTFGVRHRYLLEADGTSGRLGKHEHDYSGDRPYFHRVQPIILTLSPS